MCKKATIDLSGDSYVTISQVYFVYTSLFDHLKSCLEDVLFDSFKSSITSIELKLKEYWKLVEDNALIGVLLDPRLEEQIVRNKAVRLLEKQFKLYEAQNTIPDTVVNIEKIKPLKPLALIERLFNKKIQSCVLDSSEMVRYFSQPRVLFNKSYNIIEWWKENVSEFPILSRVAMDFLTIMPSSVSSERSFSTAGLTLTKTRNRLHSNTARKLMCLKSWNK